MIFCAHPLAWFYLSCWYMSLKPCSVASHSAYLKIQFPHLSPSTIKTKPANIQVIFSIHIVHMAFQWLSSLLSKTSLFRKITLPERSRDEVSTTYLKGTYTCNSTLRKLEHQEQPNGETQATKLPHNHSESSGWSLNLLKTYLSGANTSNIHDTGHAVEPQQLGSVKISDSVKKKSILKQIKQTKTVPCMFYYIYLLSLFT